MTESNGISPNKILWSSQDFQKRTPSSRTSTRRFHLTKICDDRPYKWASPSAPPPGSILSIRAPYARTNFRRLTFWNFTFYSSPGWWSSRSTIFSCTCVNDSLSSTSAYKTCWRSAACKTPTASRPRWTSSISTDWITFTSRYIRFRLILITPTARSFWSWYLGSYSSAFCPFTTIS